MPRTPVYRLDATPTERGIPVFSPRTFLTAAVLAPAFLLVTPAVAMADGGPGDDQGSTYQDNRSHTGRDGAYSDRMRSCVDEDGNVSYERTRRYADEDGVSTRTTRSGDDSADCDGGDGDHNSSDSEHDDNSDGNGDSNGDSNGRDDDDGSGDRSDRDGRGGILRLGGGDSLINVSVGDISLFNNGFGDDD